MSQTRPGSDHIRQSDKAFLRALIHHDYMERRDSIWLWQMRYIRQKPHTMPLVMFDYTVPFLLVQVALGQPDGGDSAWADCSARAARSRGRMQMHLVKVKDGSSTRHLVFPLRSTTGEVVAGLRRIAADTWRIQRRTIASRYLIELGDVAETDEARDPTTGPTSLQAEAPCPSAQTGRSKATSTDNGFHTLPVWNPLSGDTLQTAVDARRAALWR
ncbi:hypothetical protein B0H13DRAFT_1864403 [Mycena leptocephala]|nr:hypothetical protein B0H13DRAFT_1864403 [Mycena leptocephala]